MLHKKEFHKLNQRSIIKISGKDKFSFIQGIISNDIEILKKKTSIYSSILSPQGKFLSDFFLTIYDDSLLVEIHKDDESLVMQKLNIYKLRSDVELEIKENVSVFIISNYSEEVIMQLKLKFICFDDPRFNNLFKRLYVFNTPKQFNLIENKLKIISSSIYNDIRLKNSIPDFNIDAIKNKSLLLEMRFDELNGISWDKGCYMGQEITARMKYRNIVKRKLFKIKIFFKGKVDRDVLFNKEIIGNITSHNRIDGFAYINLKFIDKCLDKELMSGDSIVKLEKLWWSND